jgi:hypothetical protein
MKTQNNRGYIGRGRGREGGEGEGEGVSEREAYSARVFLYLQFFSFSLSCKPLKTPGSLSLRAFDGSIYNNNILEYQCIPMIPHLSTESIA